MSNGKQQAQIMVADQNLQPTTTNNSSALTEARKAESMTKLQSQLVIAKQFPRNETTAYSKIIEMTKRYSLAEKAIYTYPRAGEKISGPSIRLAEAIAQAWGNINYGFTEIEQRDGASVVEAYCHDLETNTAVSRTFTVKHRLRLKSGQDKILTDERDIYEKVANHAQRRVRAAILEVIPGDIVEEAVKACRATIAKGSDASIPFADRVRKMVLAFKDFGVDQTMIEERLGHKIELTTPEELVDLTGIFTALRDKQAKRNDFFKVGEPETGERASSLAARLKEATKTEEEPKK